MVPATPEGISAQAASETSIPADREPEGAPSDSSLLRRLRGGSQAAATTLYLRYAHRLFDLARAQCSPLLARRVDAQDIVQSVFRNFFEGVSRGLYDVAPGEQLWGLLLVIALNKIRAQGAFHRAARRDVRATLGEDHLDEAAGGAGQDDRAFAFLKLAVDETLERLDPVKKAMVVLRIEGYEVAEIAAKTGRSKRTVERILQEFREKLRGLLDEEQ